MTRVGAFQLNGTTRKSRNYNDRIRSNSKLCDEKNWLVNGRREHNIATGYLVAKNLLRWNYNDSSKHSDEIVLQWNLDKFVANIGAKKFMPELATTFSIAISSLLFVYDGFFRRDSVAKFSYITVTSVVIVLQDMKLRRLSRCV